MEKERRIVNMDTKQIRTIGLNNVKQNWRLSIGAAVLVCIIAGWGSSFIPNFSFTLHGDNADTVLSLKEGLKYVFQVSEHSKVTVNPFASLNLVHFILGGVVELGYCGFLLKQHDLQPYETRNLFSQFDRFGVGFAQRFLRTLYITLWSLLLIIPGIVADLSYSMTPYILADNPNMSAKEAISASKELMDGHKMDLLFLRLTFIGWDLLAALTFNIGNLWLNPYKHASEAAFYRKILDHQSGIYSA